MREWGGQFFTNGSRVDKCNIEEFNDLLLFNDHEIDISTHYVDPKPIAISTGPHNHRLDRIVFFDLCTVYNICFFGQVHC